MKIEKAYAKVVKEYIIDPKVGNNFNLATIVKDFKYSPFLESFFVLENGTDKIKVANMSMKQDCVI